MRLKMRLEAVGRAVHPQGVPRVAMQQHPGSLQATSLRPTAKPYGLFCLSRNSWFLAPVAPLALTSAGGLSGKKHHTMVDVCGSGR